MANVGNITANINVRTTDLQRGLVRAGKQMRTFTQQTSNQFIKVRRAILSANTALAGMGIIAVGLAVRKTITEFVKFEDALLDLQKVMSDTEGSAKQFIGITEELSKKFAKSSAEVLQGAANFKQAGFTVQEAFELQEVALRAATVSNLDVIESSKIVVRILKGFKAPASEATRVLDIMNEISNRFATNLGELATGMAQLSPVAKLMGFTFEETAAVLTPIIEVFGSGSEAAVALRTSLLRLVSDQKRVQATLKALQVNQRDVNGQLREGRDILFDVMKRFQLLNKTQKIFVAGQITGIRQAARAVEVFDGLTKVMKVHETGIDSANSALREQEIRLESTGIKLGQLGQAFINAARNIGQFFAPAINKISEILTRLIVDFGNMVSGILAVNRAFAESIDLARAAERLRTGRTVRKEGGEAEFRAALLRDAKRERIRQETRIGVPRIERPGISRIPLIQQAIAQRGLEDKGGIFGQSIRDAVNQLGQVEEGMEDIGKRADQMKKSLRTPFEILKDEATEVKKLFDLGLINTETFNRQSVKIREDFTKAMTAMETKGTSTMEALSNATQGWANNFARELTDVLFGAEVTFGSILESFARMITQMAIQLAIIQPLMQAAFGATAGGTGGGFLGNIFGGLFGGGASTAVSPSFVGPPSPFADGGIATRPTFAMLAEKKPEIVAPLSELAGMGGRGDVEINIIGAPEGTRVEEGETSGEGRRFDVILDEKVADQIRPGTKTFSKLVTQFGGLNQNLIRR